MGRTLKEVTDALPRDRRERVKARYRELKSEMEDLHELREVAKRRKRSA